MATGVQESIHEFQNTCVKWQPAHIARLWLVVMEALAVTNSKPTVGVSGCSCNNIHSKNFFSHLTYKI